MYIVRTKNEKNVVRECMGMRKFWCFVVGLLLCGMMSGVAWAQDVSVNLRKFNVEVKI